MKRIQGFEQDADSHVWIHWRPRTTGKHDLHAVVLEPGDDPVPGNSVARLEVQVVGSQGKNAASGR